MRSEKSGGISGECDGVSGECAYLVLQRYCTGRNRRAADTAMRLRRGRGDRTGLVLRERGSLALQPDNPVKYLPAESMRV
jgi:hypothetical protein